MGKAAWARFKSPEDRAAFIRARTEAKAARRALEIRVLRAVLVYTEEYDGDKWDERNDELHEAAAALRAGGWNP